MRDADFVVLATPVGAFGALARQIAPHLKPGAIVSDVGSVKAAVIRDVGPHIPPGVHFVPAHPIAGTEQSGPEAGFAELFDGRWCVLTPPHGTDPQRDRNREGLLAALRQRSRDHGCKAPRSRAGASPATCRI